ncbi:curved DNA-binding protein [Zestomonas carbonaria]|uniref:Curved DNA-binding protein n=1 Tax=Zestomonas carbonaria TaxID=2762745 RepID=A0A7U7I8E2_9GAMM|nr:curved DNA-binding protein [Pseudomonas carbonaria]CAD5107021.1 Curved DNA-binding protein [Pseudomonas carbonaria]
MEFKDYYAALGVAPDADEKAIKTAYRRLARKYHPDVSKEADAEDKFKEVAEAYEVLGDAQKRAEYDELRRYGGRQGQSFEPPPGWHSAAGGFDDPHGRHEDFSDFFESLFGAARSRGQPRSHRGRDLEVELPIFLEESQSGEAKQVSFSLPQFDAAGRRIGDAQKTLNVKIPRGVVDGERIRLKGQGGPGINGGAAGDLYLVIRLVPHPLFDVDGRDLIVTVPVAPWEAALGAKVEVPTLGGRIHLSIPANSQTGQRLRIKGKGLADKQDGHGDLYALLKVVMPPRSDEDARELWRQLADRAGFDPRSTWSRQA